MDDYDDYDDDRGGISPFRMLGLFGMIAPAMGMLLAASLWLWMIIYIVGRWRLHRSGWNDPDFGAKFVLHVFRFHGYHVMLLGAFLILFGIVSKGLGDKGPLWRAAFALLTSGGLIFGATTFLLTRTNQEQQPLVGRMCNGSSLFVSGMIAMVGLVGGFLVLFAEGPMGNDGRGLWAIVFVYVTALAVQGAIFSKRPLGAGPVDGPSPPPPPAPTVPEPMRQPLG
jgi:hypothetical protein